MAFLCTATRHRHRPVAATAHVRHARPVVATPTSPAARLDWYRYDEVREVAKALRRRQRDHGYLLVTHPRTGARVNAVERTHHDAVLAFIRRGPQR